MKSNTFKIINKIFKIFCKIISKKQETNFLGTPYGGWYFLNPINAEPITLISAGVGEDISFDIEFMSRFNCKVIFIDPTPRAVSHIENVINNLGNKNKSNYDLNSGEQSVESYNLSKIEKENFSLIKKALFNKSGLTVKFFLPKNINHVSHSISNFQNNFSTKTDYIEVQTITLYDIIVDNRIKNIDLLKLDIEGAENQVIPYLIEKKILPDQILVEFDELSTSFIKPYAKALVIFIKLIFNNYVLIETNDFPNFLFVKKGMVN